MPLLLPGAGHLEGLLAERPALSHATGHHIALTEPGRVQGIGEGEPEGDALLERALEEGQRLGHAARQGIRCAQLRGAELDDEREVQGFSQRQAPFEYAYGLGQRALAEGEMADDRTRQGQAEGAIDRLRQPEGHLAVSPSLGKGAQFRQAPGQESPGRHGGDDRQPKASRAAPRARSRRSA